jgi:hypothetical protein
MRYESSKFHLEYNNRQVSFFAPDKCPICHQFAVLDKPLTHVFDGLHAQVVFRCPNSRCGNLFIAYYDIIPRSDPRLRSTEPFKRVPEEVSDIVKGISPDFVAIFAEANIAKEEQLLQICGPGYRKAFEFLIKDYAKRKASDEKEKGEIEQSFSGKVVKEYIDDPRIQSVAKRALWLGNDETHYLRKWGEHDIEDLINLIRLTIHWIEIEELSLEYVSNMPD